MPLPPADILSAIANGNKFNAQPVAQRFPTAEQLGKRVDTGQMSRESGLAESDRIQAELLRRAIQGR